MTSTWPTPRCGSSAASDRSTAAAESLATITTLRTGGVL
jgi:hypothetical protein